MSVATPLLYYIKPYSFYSGGALFGRSEASWPGWDNNETSNAQEKMKRLMDLPATDDLEWTRHDRWVGIGALAVKSAKLVLLAYYRSLDKSDGVMHSKYINILHWTDSLIFCTYEFKGSVASRPLFFSLFC